MPLPDVLPIRPFVRPARGTVQLPGSKSLTNRALLLAALGAGAVTIEGALFSEDTEIMAAGLRALGFSVREDAARRTIAVEGRGGAVPAEQARLHVGLAGTAARFLTALCAASRRGVYRIDGVPQMRKRPMKGLFDALAGLGATIVPLGEPDFFPVEIHASGLRGGAVEIDASESSQMLSALLMVAPLAPEPLTIRLRGDVRWPFVAMTLGQMAQFGYAGKIGRDGDRLTVPLGAYAPAATYPVEPDATAASYFAALPLVAGGAVVIPHLAGPGAGLQGDTAFLNVVEACGARVQSMGGATEVMFDPAAGARGVALDFRTFSDTFLTLAAIAPLLDGPTRIAGIAHTRKQETDRVAGMARELRRLGQEVVETEDALEIRPRPLVRGVEVETYGDHRFAMSFAILGCRDVAGDGSPWLSIRNPACCAKTFPNFFDVLDGLWENARAIP